MIFALLASLYVVILDVNVQSMLARTAAGFLSDKLDTEVKIRTFYIKPDLRIHAEEVQINDKMHYPMLYVGYLDAKLSIRDLANELRVRNITIDDLLVNLVKYEDSYDMNISELFPKSEDGEKTKSQFPKSTVYLDRINITNGHVIVWDQNKDKPEKIGMDYSHLDIDSISLSMRNLSYNGDVVTGYFDHLSAVEKSGFTVEEFMSKSQFQVSSQGLDFRNLELKSKATDLNLDLQFIYDGYRNFTKFVDSIMIVANIKDSQLTLSDLRYFSKTMGKMTDTLQISGLINGFVRDFTANNFSFSFKDSTDFLGTIKMRGLPYFFETHIVGEVEKMNFTYQDLAEFAIPTPTGKIPLPEMLSSVNNALLSGEFYGFHNNFNTNFNLHTNIGNIYFNGALNNDLLIAPKPYYFYSMHVNNLDLKKLLGMRDELLVSFASDMSGEGMTKNDADLMINFNIEKLKAFDNNFQNLNINGQYKDKLIIASANINSELIGLDLNGVVNLSDNKPSFFVDASIDNADLYRLNLLKQDEKMLLTTDVRAELRGDDLDMMFGEVDLRNTSYTDSRGTYLMDSLNMTLVDNEFNSKDISLICDFFELDINGIFNFRNIDNTFKNYVLNHFHIDKWADKGVKLPAKNQDFYVNMSLKNTETLSRLLMPNLKISENTVLTATFTSNNYQLHTTIESDEVTYNNLIFDDIYVKNKTEKDKTTLNIDLKDFVFKQKTAASQVELGVENMKFYVDLHDDSLLFNLSWDDNLLENINKGELSATYLANDNGGRLHVTSSDVIINDSLWNISPNCFIDFNKDKIVFSEFDIYSKNQSLKLKGSLPVTSKDTLQLQFDRFNISDFDLLTTDYGIDVDGFIDGSLQLSGISNKFTFLSNLDINDIGINNHVIGDAYVDANWNAPDTSIYIDAEVLRDNHFEKVLKLNGNYFTSRENDNLDFALKLNDIDITLVNAFTKGTLSRVEGKLDGDFLIEGSLKQPVLIGDADLKDAACQIDYLNTYYKVNPSNYNNDKFNRFIRFTENRIDLHDILLVDTLNHEAVAQGVITHDYLKNFNFDVDAVLDNFIGMNMLQKDGSTFYGSAIASGDLKIDGPLEDINMEINALSMPGTVIDIVLTSTESINDNFIVFVQKDSERDTTSAVISEKKKDKKFTLNLNADVTQDADVNIHLPSNMGNINANGAGNIRLGVSSEQLSLYGDYIINGGTFVFNFQNLVRRTFDLKQGGTITWTGRADDADINVVGSYRTKSSISSLGIEIDSTSNLNNVNVDCLLRLQEKLTNPTITLGLSLPNATDDIKNTVFSIIDTTNQAVMSQQIISLLVLGSFSYSNTSLYAIGASNYYNVLTSSLSSWLSQISKDFDIGVRYTPEDNITAEELEVALSTQIFDDRVTIEGNLGMYTGSRNEVAGGASSVVGDFDVTWKINNRLSLKAYNHSNANTNYYTYTYESYSNYTQGVAISYSQSFDRLRDIFVRKNKKNKIKNKINNEDDE